MNMPKFEFKMILLSLLIFLGACGGGSSSSGGGMAESNDGEYKGTLTLTQSGNAEANLDAFTGSLDISFVIQNDTVVSFTSNRETTLVSWPVENNSFVFGDTSSTMSMENNGEVTCTILIQITVNLSRGSANGSNTETVDCDIRGSAVTVTLTGTISASRE